MLKVSELRNLSVEELQEKVTALKKDLMQFRFQAKTGKLERQSAFSEVKHDIARALTIMNELNRQELIQKTPVRPAAKQSSQTAAGREVKKK